MVCNPKVLKVNKQILTRFGATALVLALSACGGSGDGDDNTAPTPSNPEISAEGVWEGTLTNSASTNFQLLVLETGEFWSIYGRPQTGSFAVAGFIQGSGSVTGGSLTSNNAKDFGLLPPPGGSVQATYTATSIQGTVAAAGSTSSFSGAPLATTNYSYGRPAALTDIQGVWSMQGTDGSSVNLSIATSGAFTAVSSGCAITGTFTPRPSGKNVFNVSLTFGQAPCANPGSAATGVAVTYPTTAANRQLIVLGTNTARTAGVGLFGVR